MCRHPSHSAVSDTLNSGTGPALLTPHPRHAPLWNTRSGHTQTQRESNVSSAVLGCENVCSDRLSLVPVTAAELGHSLLFERAPTPPPSVTYRWCVAFSCILTEIRGFCTVCQGAEAALVSRATPLPSHLLQKVFPQWLGTSHVHLLKLERVRTSGSTNRPTYSAFIPPPPPAWPPHPNWARE